MTLNIARLVLMILSTFLFVYLAVIYRHCAPKINWRSSPRRWPPYACAVIASGFVLTGIIVNQIILLPQDPFPGTYLYIIGIAFGLHAARQASKE